MLEIGTRVVVAQKGYHRAKRGVVAKHNRCKDVRGKWLDQARVDFDDGGHRWFNRAEDFVPEQSENAQSIVADYLESLPPPDLEADLEVARSVANKLDVRLALDRLRRHDDPRAAEVMIDLGMLELSGTGVEATKGVVPPSFTALSGFETTDVVALATSKLADWARKYKTRKLCRSLAASVAGRGDPRLVEKLRELSATYPDDSGLIAARVDAGDDSAFADLARARLARRDGRVELDAGDLDPTTLDNMLEALGEEAAGIEQLNIVRGGFAAFAQIELEGWVNWKGLRRFKRLNFSEAFRGKAGVEVLVASPHLSPDLQALDVSACDIGSAGCSVLGKAESLAGLRELRIDRGEFSRKKFNERALAGLFPAKGGQLHALQRLYISHWDLRESHVHKVVEAGRAPGLDFVDIGKTKVKLAGDASK